MCICVSINDKLTSSDTLCRHADLIRRAQLELVCEFMCVKMVKGVVSITKHAYMYSE